jgi:hypothetical protein
VLDPRRRLLLSEIEWQCGFALKAYSAATVALAHRDAEAFWAGVQGLLAAAAHIHRFLESDVHLRETLGVGDDSPLRQPELDRQTDVAFAFSQWVASHPRGPLRLTNVGPAGVSNADPTVFTRFLDAERSVATLFGARYDLPRILGAIATLSPAVKAELRHLQEIV